MLPLINTSVPHKDSIMLYNVKQTTHQAVLISSPQGEAYIYEGNTSHQFPCNCMMFTFKQAAAIRSDLQFSGNQILDFDQVTQVSKFNDHK